MASLMFPDSENALIMALKKIESGFKPLDSTLERRDGMELKRFWRVKAAKTVVYVTSVGVWPSSIKSFMIDWTW
ncbi:hypothetical protein HanIR_Chr06g0284031 [Helianthus annuus]|nr:hypothetical protein HanIR_Chr06g0284031 [Helianthus annuus]